MDKPEYWTDRYVQFKPHPRTHYETWTEFFDALPEKYWDRWYSWFFEPTFGACKQTIIMGNLPRWLPKFMARRMICKMAMKYNIGGDAKYHVTGSVLSSNPTKERQE